MAPSQLTGLPQTPIRTKTY